MALAGVSVAAALGFLLYQPWRRAPFALVDFSDFLPTLITGGSSGERFGRLMHIYTGEGRFMPGTLAWIDARWSVFGLDPVAWQVSAAGLMAGMLFAVYAVLRRVGVSPAGALWGVALFVVGDAVHGFWLYPQLGDPVATFCLLGAVAAAADYQRSPHPGRLALAICALLMAALWTKETSLAAVPFVVGIAGTRAAANGRALAIRGRRTSALLLAVVGTLVISLLPIVLAWRNASAAAYGAQYGEPAIHWRHATTVLGGMLLPQADSWLAAFNVAFLVVVVSGWTIAVRRGPAQPVWTALGLALSLPIAGALIYIPWPRYSEYYAAMFLLGPAYLIGFAVDQLRQTGRLAGRVATMAAAAMIGLAGSRSAFGTAQQALANRRLAGGVVEAIPPSTAASSVLLPGSGELYPPGWFEERVMRYALVVAGRPIPPVHDLSCAASESAWRSDPASVLVLIGWRCTTPSTLPRPNRRIVAHFFHLSFAHFQLVPDSVDASIWFGARVDAPTIPHLPDIVDDGSPYQR